MKGKIIEAGGRFVSETAIIQGRVSLGLGCNVWHYAVIRGDVAPITLGEDVNVQDAVLIHCQVGVPLEVDNEVAIGHHALVHCRRVGSHTLIGSRATVLDGCEIGSHCLVAAGSVVTPGTKTPDGVVLKGVPARIARDILPDEVARISEIIEGYRKLAVRHVAGEFPPLL